MEKNCCHTLPYTKVRFCVILRAGLFEGGTVFGELVIAYLFLAGAGAGGVAAASLVDLLAVREPFGLAGTVDFSEKQPAARLLALVFVASCVATALGAACLALDLGRLDRVLSLFLAPPATLMNVGAWAVALLLAVSAALALVRVLYVPWVGRTAVEVLEVAAVALAAVVALYAGLLLGTLAGVRLWSTFWVPVLFVLSAASCGCALLMAASLFVEGADAVTGVLVRTARIDALVIVAEVAAAAFFLAFALGSAHPGVQASAESLLGGAAALPWWVGFVACGLGAPLAIEVLCLARRQRFAPTATPVVALALAAVLVLGGAVGLRAAIVDAGTQRALELQESAQAPTGEAGEERESGSLPTERKTADREDISTWLS